MRYFGHLMDLSLDTSQKRLARKLEINQGRLSALISGKGKPSEEEKQLLEQFFGLPHTVLLATVGEETCKISH